MTNPSLPESKIEGVVLRAISRFDDPRGWLSEIWRHDEIDFHPSMGYISYTKPNVSRGPHEHRSQSDYFAFLWGTFRVQLWDHREWSPTARVSMSFELGEEAPASLIIPPGVVHAYTCVSPEGGLVINLPDRLYAGMGKREPVDEIRHEDDADSPFRVER